jgi:hypothetical protein
MSKDLDLILHAALSYADEIEARNHADKTVERADRLREAIRHVKAGQFVTLFDGRRLEAREAAETMVRENGSETRKREISGRRDAFDIYWAEVDRLLASPAERETELRGKRIEIPANAESVAILAGDPTSGLSVIGPFGDPSEAVKHASHWEDSDWWVVGIENPENTARTS